MSNNEPLLDDEFNEPIERKIYSARIIRIFSINKVVVIGEIDIIEIGIDLIKY